MNPFTEIYDRPEVVAEFLGTTLELPEARLWRKVACRAGTIAMLDLGVGAGRTTGFFAPCCQRYLGVDLASRMIATCRERFPHLPQCEFLVGDAAQLDGISEESFDVVLFSFNGLDCLEPASRAQCLRAVSRRLRPGGVFLFSAHNLQMIDHYFRTPEPGTDEAQALSPELRARIVRHNDLPESYAQRSWAMFWDGVYGDDGTLRHVYIRPRQQLADLREAGFNAIEVLSTVTGETLADDALEAARELSIAYWCEVTQ